jgi:hypothetical protein
MTIRDTQATRAWQKQRADESIEEWLDRLWHSDPPYRANMCSEEDVLDAELVLANPVGTGRRWTRPCDELAPDGADVNWRCDEHRLQEHEACWWDNTLPDTSGMYYVRERQAVRSTWRDHIRCPHPAVSEDGSPYGYCRGHLARFTEMRAFARRLAGPGRGAKQRGAKVYEIAPKDARGLLAQPCAN